MVWRFSPNEERGICARRTKPDCYFFNVLMSLKPEQHRTNNLPMWNRLKQSWKVGTAFLWLFIADRVLRLPRRDYVRSRGEVAQSPFSFLIICLYTPFVVKFGTDWFCLWIVHTIRRLCYHAYALIGKKKRPCSAYCSPLYIKMHAPRMQFSSKNYYVWMQVVQQFDAPWHHGLSFYVFSFCFLLAAPHSWQLLHPVLLSLFLLSPLPGSLWAFPSSRRISA